MAAPKITYTDKIDQYPVVNRVKQVVADDLNEIKTVINQHADYIDNSHRGGSATINSGTTPIGFVTPFSATYVAGVEVIAEVRRVSDNAVVDFVISGADINGFNITVWDDNINVKYVALPLK